MEDFDPKAYLASQTSTPEVPVDDTQVRNFDPKAYLANTGIEDYNKSQAEFGGALNTGLAGAAGLARTSTLGLSDLAMTGSGWVKPETLVGLKEANPIVSGAAELGGTALLLAGTGGTSMLAKGAGTLGKLAAGALEGGAIGAGQLTSDYALGDHNLTAQKIAAHVGGNALFGAGAGLLGQAAEVALPKVFSKLSGSLENLKNLVSPGEELPSGPIDWASKLKLGLQSGGDNNSGIRSFVKNFQDIYSDSKKAVQAHYDAASSNIKEALQDMPLQDAQGNADQTVRKITDMMGGFSEDASEPFVSNLSSPISAKIVRDELQGLAEDIGSSKSSYAVQDALSDFAKKIDQKKIIKFDTLPTASQISDQELLVKMRDTIRGDLKDPKMWGDAAHHYEQASDAYASFKQSQKLIQKAFMKAESGPYGTRTYVSDPAKFSAFVNQFGDASQDLKKQYLNNFIDQVTNLSKSGENYSGFVKGTESIADHVSELAKKQESLANIADIMSQSGSTNLGRQGVLALAAKAAGISNPIIGAAVGAANLYGAVANPYATGVALSKSFQMLKSVGEIAQKVTNSIESGSKSIFSKNAESAVSEGLSGFSESQFAKQSARIKELSENVKPLMDHLESSTSALNEPMPNVSTALHATITSGVQFLASKLPRPVSELPLSADWNPTDSQKRQFMQYYSAVSNPLGVLKQVRSGVLPSATLEALKAVHPQLLQEMQQSIIANMNRKHLSSLNYSTKIALGKFLDQPLEASMLPASLAAKQATFVMPSPASQGRQAKSSVGGIGKLEISNRMLTGTQERSLKGIK